jgi:hypothetical protein
MLWWQAVWPPKTHFLFQTRLPKKLQKAEKNMELRAMAKGLIFS